MAELVLILGNSGTGKTRSVKNLDPSKTLIINVLGKTLPFRVEYQKLDSKTKTGNMAVFHKVDDIIKTLQYVEKERDFDYYIIDDFNYIMSYEFFERAKETGYQKFTDIGRNIYNLFNHLKQMPENKIVFILGHTEEQYSENGKFTKIKTIGKLLDEKFTLEGLCTIVLGTSVERDIINKKVNYYFITQNSGNDTLKSPEEMFEDLKIPNDLNYVVEKIKEYYPNKFKTN
ncbi:MAG TPA: AAA family ATPase [bacterium]|nr:AAA family ATPase [bacterium]